MAIRITRNEEGNCITFVGSTNPAYWNACLSSVINSEDSSRIDIINDIRSSNSDDIQYEFYAVEYTAFADRDGNAFASAQAAVDYINANANVIGVSDVGADLTDIVVNFRLDQTSTSIIMDNGSSFGVNTIKAVADADGTIHIHAIGAGSPDGEYEPHDHKHFEKLAHTNVQVNGAAVAGGLQDVVNTLNELFTVGPFEAVVISDPYATRVADQTGSPAGYTLEGLYVVDPIGDDIAGATGNTHRAGIKSTATISQAGEFFTFQIRGLGTIGLGLVHTQDSYDNGYYNGNAAYADPAQYKVGNSPHFGYQFSHHFSPSGPWTHYGANVSYTQLSGWSNGADQFIGSDEGNDWLAGNPVKMKVGIDYNGYISIEYWNEDQDRYIPISRSGYPVPEGSEYHLGVSFWNTGARLYSAPLVHRLAADEEVTTIGTDAITAFGDITGNLAGGVSTATGVGLNDGIITTETIDSAGEYWEVEVTDNEWSIISLLYHQDNQPSVVAAAANAGPLSANDYSFFGGHIQSDGAMNNSIYKSGSGAGANATNYPKVADGVKWRIGFDTDGKAAIWQSQDGTAFNLMWKSQTAAPSGDYSLYWRGTTAGAGLESVAKGQLSLAPTLYFRYIESPDNNFEWPLFATEAEANYYDANHQGTTGTGTSHTHTYADDPTNTTWYMPDTGNAMTGSTPPSGVWLSDFGGITYTEITSLTDSDLAPARFNGTDYTHVEGTAVNYQLFPAGATFTQTVTVSPAGSGMVYNSVSGYLQGTLSEVTSDTIYTVSVTRANSYGSNVGTFEVLVTDVPAPATNSTDWNKALDFNGSSEHLKQVSTQSFANALRMDNTAVTTTAPTWATGTSAAYQAKPWATAVVFNIDSVSQNQHIWNQGEGTATGDDNIYLRLSASKQLIFGWNREGSGKNECLIQSAPLGTNAWYGVYVAHNGTRLSAANATATNLAAAFDIRLMNSVGNNWTLGSNLSVPAAWTDTGARMDHSIGGDFTVGGRGTNRNFRGEVASMVVTTLKKDVAMPSDAEIEKMVMDPSGWLTDYKVGNNYRYNVSNSSNFQTGVLQPSLATQVWLMGDGTNDSYSNGIRNQVNPSEQNYGKMQLNSMVSNDIQTVNISGLT